MKKIFKLLLVILMLLVGLAGCDGGTNNKKMNQKQLWEYLSKYPRYLTVMGFENSAFVFENDDDLTLDNSICMGEDSSFYFTKLLSFSNENDYLYRLEYENPYPDIIPNAIFYIEINPDDDTVIKLGLIDDGEIFYSELYADIGLTSDELLAKLGAHDTWREDNNEYVGYFFAKVIDKKEFGFGIMNSGYGTIGDIVRVDYYGYMLYTITVDYEGYEGDEMTDPYDPYTLDYYISYNPHYDVLYIALDGEMVLFIPKTDSDDDYDTESFNLISALSKYAIWIETSPNTGNSYLKVYDNKFDLNYFAAGGFIPGVITDVKDNGNNYYTITAFYQGDDSGNYGVPEKSFSKAYTIYYEPDSELLKVDYYDEWITFIPDKGLHPDQFIVLLSRYEVWVERPATGDGSFIRVYDGNKFDKGIIPSDYIHRGIIESVTYWGNNLYGITVYYPENDSEAFGYESYTESYMIYYQSELEMLIFELDGVGVYLGAKK